MANAVNWFEIPAADFPRARKFYETIFDIELMVVDADRPSGMFPADWQKGEIGGSVTAGDGFVPSDKGTVVFLNGGSDLSVSVPEETVPRKSA